MRGVVGGGRHKRKQNHNGQKPRGAADEPFLNPPY